MTTPSSLRQFAGLAGGKSLAMALNMVVTALVGRLVGPSGLGRWSLLLAAGTLLHTGLINWTHASTVRYGREEWERTRSLNRSLGARIPLLMMSMLLAAVVLALQPANWLQRWFGAEPTDLFKVALLAVSIWIAAEAKATLQATGRILWEAVLSPIVAVASVIGLAFLIYTEWRSLGVVVVVLGTIPTIGWGTAWIYSLAQSATVLRRLSVRDLPRHFRFGVPMLPAFAVGYVSDWGDHLLLRHFSSLADVGMFGIAYQLMIGMLAVNGLLTTVLLPRLIAREVRRPGATRVYVAREIPTLCVLWMLVTIWLVAVLPVGLRLAMGPAFAESTLVLMALFVAIPSSSIASLYSLLCNVQERLDVIFWFTLLMTGANLSISLLLIPTYGAFGAALGTALSYALYAALHVWYQHKTIGIQARAIWILWVIGLALGVTQLLVEPTIGLRVAWAAVASAVVVGVVRSCACVDPSLVERVLSGRLNLFARLVRRALVREK